MEERRWVDETWKEELNWILKPKRKMKKLIHFCYRLFGIIILSFLFSSYMRFCSCLDRFEFIFISEWESVSVYFLFFFCCWNCLVLSIIEGMSISGWWWLYRYKSEVMQIKGERIPIVREKQRQRNVRVVLYVLIVFPYTYAFLCCRRHTTTNNKNHTDDTTSNRQYNDDDDFIYLGGGDDNDVCPFVYNYHLN